MKGKMSALVIALILLTIASCKTKQPSTEKAEKANVETTSAPSSNSITLASCPALSRGAATHNDPIAEMEATIKQNCLVLNLRYSGGCEEHHIEVFWDGNWKKSKPAVVSLNISHNANGDNCESIGAQVLEFDLIKLRSNWGQEVIVELNANGVPMKRLNYKY